jgi:glycosyltransferase involved in cell wall biosynthesis
MPRITIGMPVYNGALYLKQAIESVLSQSFADFELVISDNASTDATSEICKEYVGRDSRIVYSCNSKNLGAAENFNRVARMARGDFFAWANHDDLWATTYFERCIVALEKDPDAVLAYTRSAIIDESGDVTDPLFFDLNLTGSAPQDRLRRFYEIMRLFDARQNWGTLEPEGLWIPVYGLIRTRVLQHTRLIGPYISSDTVLLEELAMLGRFIGVDETLFFKRDHPGRSMRACQPFEQRISWFTGRPSGRWLFPHWKLLGERAALIASMEFAPTTKLGCLSAVLGLYARRRQETKWLVKDIVQNARQAWIA